MARSRWSLAVVVLALAEVALIAAIVLLIIDRGLAPFADLIAQVPGGRLVLALGAFALLLVAALAMTRLVSD